MSLAENKAVFLSYASQDAEAARRICEALRAAGVEVWFDQNELRGGDAWDAKIRGQIAACALFVPVVSANTQARREGYFRLEWKLAAQRTHMISERAAFLLPVVIDATSDKEADVPGEFRAVQWTRLPGGETNGKFCERVGNSLGDEVVQVGPVVDRAPGRRPGLQRKRPPFRAWLVPAIVCLAALVTFAIWQPWKAVAPSASAAEKSGLPASAAPIAISDKSLVVLPLENLSPDPENAFFTDGIHAEIIATLQRLPDLKVISRDSAIALKGSTAPLAEKAQKVGVAHAISGSVRRAGTSVRVQLELSRARDEVLLWTQSYDKELGEGVIAIQSDIADQVARVLQARERKGTYAGAQFMTKNPEAYDLFLKARQTHYAERGAEGRQKVITGLERVLALDPAFSSAARLLATSLILCCRLERNPAAQLRYAGEAKRWAETAQRLLPGGAGDDALASYYAQIDPDNARALSLAENAVKALPSDAAVVLTFAIALSSAGRSGEGARRYRQAISLDPSNSIFRNSYLATLARMRRSGEFAEAATEYTIALGQIPAQIGMNPRYLLEGTLPRLLDGLSDQERVVWLQRSRRQAEALPLIEAILTAPDLDDEGRWSAWTSKCDALRGLQRESEAAQAAQEAKAWMEKVNTAPTFDASLRDGRRASMLARLGQAEEAIAAGRRYVVARSPENQVAARWAREVTFAELHAYLNRPRECVELLAKLLMVPSGLSVPMLRVDPKWDNVREDPAFKALLADPKNSAPL